MTKSAAELAIDKHRAVRRADRVQVDGRTGSNAIHRIEEFAKAQHKRQVS